MGYATKFTKQLPNGCNDHEVNGNDHANGTDSPKLNSEERKTEETTQSLQNGVEKHDLYESESTSTSSGSEATRQLTLENSKSIDLAGKYIALAGISRKKKKAIVFPTGKARSSSTTPADDTAGDLAATENGGKSKSKFRSFHRRWKKSSDFLQYASAGE